jgi:hypothetical protein
MLIYRQIFYSKIKKLLEYFLKDQSKRVYLIFA